MAVPVPVILGVVIVVVVMVVLFIIYKILQRKRKAAGTDSSEKSSKKINYEKLEKGEQELEQETDDGEDSKNTKSKKKKKKRKGRTAGTSDYSDGAIDSEGVSGLDKNASSDRFTDGFSEGLLSARLQISASYSLSRKEVFVTIHRGENLAFGSTPTSEVRITLLPAKTQRFKTKCRSSSNPVFDESFTFGEVYPEDLQVSTVRARVYRLNERRRILVGEMKAHLSADLGLEETNAEYLWRDITPAKDISDDISDTVLVTDPETALMAPKETVPMLQISLQHKAVTGKLTVEIIKARHMKTVSIQKAPETFVEVALLNSFGGEIANAKTSVCKGSYHPTFEETFYFPAIEFELEGLTLVFSVYCKKFRRKELVGWFRIGRESTGEREQLHWNEMTEARGEPIKGWYPLTYDG